MISPFLSALCVSLLLTQSRGIEVEEDVPQPCCFPFKFQAIIRAEFDSQRITRLSRDWGRRLQVQDSHTLTANGLSEWSRRVHMDYSKNITYVITQGGACTKTAISSGMLEPCMPLNATYMGESVLGYSDNAAKVQTFWFQRQDLNRHLNMTVAVTSDRCVPVMEHIQGTIGQNHVDNHVLFSNVTRTVDESFFQLPDSCLEA